MRRLKKALIGFGAEIEADIIGHRANSQQARQPFIGQGFRPCVCRLTEPDADGGSARTGTIQPTQALDQHCHPGVVAGDGLHRHRTELDTTETQAEQFKRPAAILVDAAGQAGSGQPRQRNGFYRLHQLFSRSAGQSRS